MDEKRSKQAHEGEILPPEKQVIGPSAPTTIEASPHTPISITTNNLNIQPSSLDALERIGKSNPDLAKQIVDSTTVAERLDASKYKRAVNVTAALCACVLICSTYIISTQGFLAGTAFFLTVVAVSAIIGAALTGRLSDMSWTAEIIKSVIPSNGSATHPKSESDS